MDLLSRVHQLASGYHHRIVEIRRHLHAHPELSFAEWETARFVAAQLRAMGLEPREGIAGTGLTALVEGADPRGEVIALRADMDALPIVEQNEVPYRSRNEGVMHACGHDAHTASLLGAAWILQQLRGEFNGTVKLIFQPGEEKAPGGASLMIGEGVLENPRPARVLGQHVMTQLPVGKAGFRPGLYMASADEIYVTVRGRGGHAAMPDKLIDPVLIASHLIVALQQLVSRRVTPTIPSVLSFGKVIAQGATNIIPNEVYIEGTFRTLDERWRAEAHGIMKGIAENLASAMGGSCEFNILKGYPFLHNHEATTLRAREAAVRYLGAENVVDLDVWMAAEDFAFYSQQVESCFYRIGVRNEERGITSGVHTPTFDIDERALETGAGLMAWLALVELGADRR
jgi:amidohydrolase